MTDLNVTYPKQQLVNLLNEVENGLRSQAWWKSRKRKDMHRRGFSLAMLNELRVVVEFHQMSADAVIRQARKLLVEPESLKEVVGQSVGFKRPRSGRLRWIDVLGAVDPAQASITACDSSTGVGLLQDGYRVYGISPMIVYRKPTIGGSEERTRPSGTRM